MKKKLILLCTFFVVCMLLCSCTTTPGNSTGETTAASTTTAATVAGVSLTQEEIGILEAMGSDVNKVSAEDYVAVVTAITEHTHDYIGQVYQFEGICVMQEVHEESAPYVVNSVEIDGQETLLGLELRYLEKEIPENANIRVSAIVGEETHDGHTHAVLEVVAIETI